MTDRDTAFNDAFDGAKARYFAGDLGSAFSLLQRAHILGQNRLGRHWSVHVWMLRVGWRRRDAREVAGQWLRLALTPIGHLTGRLPAGNTGGADVSAFASLPIPPELQSMMDERAPRTATFDTAAQWQGWFALAAALVVMDQAVKGLVAAALPLHARVEVSSWFNLVHVLNSGAAFSFLADAGGWQRPFLIATGLAVSAWLLWMLRRGVTNRLEALGYAGVIGGALGNVIDRVRLGAVVDYLDLHWKDWHWPAFNVADIFVVGGAGLLVLAASRTRSPSD
jgi:signal peptidase II